MKFVKHTILLALIAPIIQIHAQRAIAVQPESKGNKQLEIGDCFGLKTYAANSSFQSIEGKSHLIKQYFWNRSDKGRHYYKVSISDPNNEVLWIHTDSLNNGWKKYIESQKKKKAFPENVESFNPSYATLHFSDENEGWLEGSGCIVNFKRKNNGRILYEFKYAYPNNNQASATQVTQNACIVPWGKTEQLVSAAVVNDNIEIFDINGNLKITDDGGNGIVYGQTVHRSEFGITKGLFWSPKGNKLAFYRKDEKRVTDYPIFSIKPRPAKADEFKYPMAGDSSHTVSIGIFDRNSDVGALYLKTEGPYDQYLTNITWSPDERSVYVAWVNREQNHMQLRQYNAETGELMGVLFEEKHDKYVEPENGPAFLPGSNNAFIWQSERDGYNHLYVYENDTLRQLTKGDWIVTEFLGFDASGKYALVNSTLDGIGGNALERTPLLIDIKTGDYFELSVGFGMNSPSWHSKIGILTVSFSNLSTPGSVYAIDINDFINNMSNTIEVKATLLEEIENPASEFEIGLISLSSIQNDGIQLFTRTYYPANFDPKKQYPAVVYVYGGPHAQMIQNKWLGGGNLWMAYMASKGYIVFTLDNRGSANRGFDFENAIHRQVGELEMRDQLAGLNYLKGLNYIDTNRIGVHGWSFGGFMTTSLMTRHPGKYKVGVAGGPVIDWKYYEIMYTERYMDMPSENPEGYKKNSLLQYAPDLSGRLLMIHGADDNVVVWQHSLMFLDKCVKANNANLDYFVYPGHEHNVIGRDRVHLYKKVSQYFFDHL